MYTLLENIAIKEDEEHKVQNAHRHLVNILEGKARVGSLPTAKDFLLTGSYARETKISPLDDVDIFYIIGKANNVTGGWHTLTNCDFDFGPDFLDADNNISSVKILGLIKKELATTYGQSEIRRDGEVVNLFLSSYGVGFDIIPVFEIENEDYFLMPQGKGFPKWKKSNPLIDHAVITNLDEKHNYLVKDIVKIAKYWFSRKRIRAPRSYHLEAIAYVLFDTLPQSLSDHNTGLKYLLNYLNFNDYLMSCPDPTGLSEPLTSGLTVEDIDNIKREAAVAIQHLSRSNEEFVSYVN